MESIFVGISCEKEIVPHIADIRIPPCYYGVYGKVKKKQLPLPSSLVQPTVP